MKASNLTTLIIDDQRCMRSVVRTLLRSIGIVKVEEADGVTKAVDLLNKMRVYPDFILCDLHMADGGGIDFINKMRRDEFLKTLHIPVIVLTGESDPMMLDVSRQVGAAAILSKPCSAEELGRTIASIVGFSLVPSAAAV